MAWNYYDGLETSDVPLRVRYIGDFAFDTDSEPVAFDIQYDIVSFFSGPEAFDPEEMEFVYEDWFTECDVSAYCADKPGDALCSAKRGPSLPELPYGFSAAFEMTVNHEGDGFPGFDNKGTSIGEMYYDYDGDRAHMVWRFLDGYYENAFHQLDMLEEEHGGQSWKWLGDGIGSTPIESDDDLTTCFMNATTGNYSGYDYVLPVAGGHIVNPHRLFLFDDETRTRDGVISNETFLGYTTKRGIPAQKWLSTINIELEGDHDSSEFFFPWSTPENQMIRVTGSLYYYFSTVNWTFSYMANESVIPIGVDMEGLYEVYNWSDDTSSYSILDSSTTLRQYSHTVSFLADTPDENYFSPPTQWRKYCEIDAAYCSD